MKKTWLLALMPLIFLASGCSLLKDDKTNSQVKAPDFNTEGNICAIPATSSEEINNKTILPPVSQEEKNKTFTYEDEEMGVKMQYPGSCYFNKGIFQCSDFTLSVWTLDAGSEIKNMPQKTFLSNQTQIKYTYSHNNTIYALMAAYDGADNEDLDKVIDKIAKSLTFTR